MAGEIKPQSGPGRYPLVFSGNTGQFLLSFRWRSWPHRGSGPRRKVYPSLLKNLFVKRQRLDAGRCSTVPGVVNDQLDDLVRR